MGSLSSVYIKKEALKTLLDVVTKKGEKGVELTISIGDELNQYDQNLSAYVSQTEEQRKAKKDRFYVGNGKCFWSDGKISTFKELKEATPEGETHTAEVVNSEEEEEDDLPF